MMQHSQTLDSTSNIELVVTLRWLDLGLKPGLRRDSRGLGTWTQS